MDKDFFSNYEPKPKGIRGIKMNVPIVKKNKLGTIGLELEVEGNNLPQAFDLGHLSGKATGAMWETHADGSLRGESCEYVFNVPCANTELADLVNGLFDSYKAKKTKLNLSNRCSTHVHINMGGAKINELTSVLALWMTFEDPLVAWHGEERINNHFCLTSSQTNQVANAWRNFLEGFEWPAQEGLKYSSLNVLTLWKFGSFEFRVGRGADSPEYVITWATFLDRFCDYARKTFHNPQLIGSGISEQSGVELFRSILRDIEMVDFGEEVITNFGGVDNFNEACVKGFRNAQPFVGIYPWNEWMPLIDKQYIPNPFEQKAEKPYVGRRLPPLEGPIVENDMILRDLDAPDASVERDAVDNLRVRVDRENLRIQEGIAGIRPVRIIDDNFN